MSSRLRKRRNQRAKYVQSKTVAKLAQEIGPISGCSYGVHPFRYEGDFKICKDCGATYSLTEPERLWLLMSNSQVTFEGGPLDGQTRKMEVYVAVIPVGIDSSYINTNAQLVDFTTMQNSARTHYRFFVNGRLAV